MNLQKKAIVIGAGGHCRTVISTLKACGVEVEGILDQKKENNETVLDVPILAERSHYIHYLKTHDFYLAIGDNSERQTLFDAIILKGGKCPTLIHPEANVDKSCTIGKGSLIANGVILCPETVIGSNVIINTRVLIEHNCNIEDHVHVAPDTTLAGSVCILHNAFVGLKSSIRDKVKVSAHSVVGAGSVVVSEVPPYTTVAGNPARVLSISNDDINKQDDFAVIQISQPLKIALEKMDYFGKGYLFVVSNEGVIKGILTDGLIRRYLLAEGSLEDCVEYVMNTEFTYIFEDEFEKVFTSFSKIVHFIPIVTRELKIKQVIHDHEVSVYMNNKLPRQSHELKAIYQWSQDKQSDKYRVESLNKKLMELNETHALHFYPDLTYFLNILKRKLQHEKIAISKKCALIYPEVMSVFKQQHETPSIVFALDKELMNMPNCKVIRITPFTRPSIDAYLSILSMRPSDAINAESAVAITSTVMTDFLHDEGFIHSMQCAIAIDSLKQFNKREIHFNVIVNYLKKYLQIEIIEHYFENGIFVKALNIDVYRRIDEQCKHLGFKCEKVSSCELLLRPPWPALKLSNE